MDWTARVTQFWREWTAKQGIEAAEGWLELTPEKAIEFAAAFASEVERETRQELAHEIRRLKGISPSTEEEYIADGWRKIGDTGVWERNGSFSTTLSHYCGLQGFGQSYDDTCPACDAYRDARAILAGGGQGRVRE